MNEQQIRELAGKILASDGINPTATNVKQKVAELNAKSADDLTALAILHKIVSPVKQAKDQDTKSVKLFSMRINPQGKNKNHAILNSTLFCTVEELADFLIYQPSINAYPGIIEIEYVEQPPVQGIERKTDLPWISLVSVNFHDHPHKGFLEKKALDRAFDKVDQISVRREESKKLLAGFDEGDFINPTGI